MEELPMPSRFAGVMQPALRDGLGLTDADHETPVPATLSIGWSRPSTPENRFS